MANDLLMPKMGESVAEATIIKWLKNEGDKVSIDEPVLEIATDKVDSEVPSPFEGILLKKNFAEGEVVQVGKVIAVIGAPNESTTTATTNTPSTPNTPTASQTPASTSTSTSIEKPATATVVSTSNRFYSPLVRSIAAQEGISQAELDTINGTGKDGRVTKNDILNYIPNRNKSVTPSAATTQAPPTQTPAQAPTIITPSKTEPVKPAIPIGPNDEIIEMDRMRKIIAENMVASKRISPHVTSFVEADVSNIVIWRDKVKKEFEKREKEKLTFTPIFIEAIVKAIKDFPMINISVDGTNIIKRGEINIGMATALPTGNLIVPVIKKADQLNLLGLTKAVNDLANRARNNKLSPDELAGGTYTISNVGSFGNVMGTPIIPQPQVAILAVGAIRKKPAVIETPLGDTIGIRHLMFLSHSYDHRVIDGSLGGQFVRRVADYLENFDVNREI
jgi:2-oxoglutarate dehydrogenase E2 component (dihydrolipoamide succinyltransferase)